MNIVRTWFEHFRYFPSHCTVLGNTETANMGTISMWRLSSHSARLRRRRNTKLTFQDIFQEKKQWQAFG
jgi:hypothetical protein